MTTQEEREELEDDDCGYVDPAAPSVAQQAGGAPREYAIVALLAALLGLAASLELALSEIKVYRYPDAHLLCDVNPLVGCSSSLTSPQAHAFFGVPNSLVGLAFFGGVAALALSLWGGGRLPRFVWWALSGACVAFLGFIAYFVHQSITVFGTLCPWCMCVWAAVILLSVHTWARAAQAGHLPLGAGLTRVLVLNRWLLVLAFVVVIYGAALAGLWDKVMLIL